MIELGEYYIWIEYFGLYKAAKFIKQKLLEENSPLSALMESVGENIIRNNTRLIPINTGLKDGVNKEHTFRGWMKCDLNKLNSINVFHGMKIIANGNRHLTLVEVEGAEFKQFRLRVGEPRDNELITSYDRAKILLYTKFWREDIELKLF